MTLTCFDDLMLDAMSIPIGNGSGASSVSEIRAAYSRMRRAMIKRHTGYSSGSPPSRLRDHCIAGPRSLQTSKFWNWARASDSLGLWPAVWALRSGRLTT